MILSQFILIMFLVNEKKNKQSTGQEPKHIFTRPLKIKWGDSTLAGALLGVKQKLLCAFGRSLTDESKDP